MSSARTAALPAGRRAERFLRSLCQVIELRAPIQRAWGPGGLVHVADNPDISGPGQRVSQTRIKLRNHGDLVAVEAFTYSDGAPKPNPSLGLDGEIKVAGVGGFANSSAYCASKHGMNGLAAVLEIEGKLLHTHVVQLLDAGILGKFADVTPVLLDLTTP